jgi:transposase-like protein
MNFQCAVLLVAVCVPCLAEHPTENELRSKLASLKAQIAAIEKEVMIAQVNGEHCPLCGRTDKVKPVPGRESEKLYCHRCFIDWKKGTKPKLKPIASACPCCNGTGFRLEID